MSISPFSNVGNLDERSADIPVRFGVDQNEEDDKNVGAPEKGEMRTTATDPSFSLSPFKQ